MPYSWAETRMKIHTKRIRVISMTQEEIRKFHDLLERATAGHTSHYAEDRLTDGSFLGVQVDPEADRPERPFKSPYPVS